LEEKKHEVPELCTTILANGHTLVHLLAQRQKIDVLIAVLEKGVDVHTRNGQGETPLYSALHYNALYSAKVISARFIHYNQRSFIR
jgi:ankyrin repeat protein